MLPVLPASDQRAGSELADMAGVADINLGSVLLAAAKDLCEPVIVPRKSSPSE